jgi:hypothetical protein
VRSLGIFVGAALVAVGLIGFIHFEGQVRDIEACEALAPFCGPAPGAAPLSQQIAEVQTKEYVCIAMGIFGIAIALWGALAVDPQSGFSARSRAKAPRILLRGTAGRRIGLLMGAGLWLMVLGILGWFIGPMLSLLGLPDSSVKLVVLSTAWIPIAGAAMAAVGLGLALARSRRLAPDGPRN